MTLADLLHEARNIADVERALAGVERRQLSFIELMREAPDANLLAEFARRFPTAHALAERANLVSFPPLLDAVRRLVQQ
ncbi:MAG: hypothetical protein AB1761_16775 [Pseudomonadota bacterium]